MFSIPLRLSDSVRYRRGFLFLSMDAIFQLWHMLIDTKVPIYSTFQTSDVEFLGQKIEN